ncbi:DUF3106 domain-containing protein, partial [Lysobacter sp. 2RAB21]
AWAAPPPPGPAAKTAVNLPSWDQLSQAQREQLIAPMRDRWNSSPEERPRMLEHARRWQQMTPEERQDARRGMKRWEHLNPEERGQMRALFGHMRGLDDNARRALMEKWRTMTPEQRRAWVQANPPPPKPDRSDRPDRPDRGPMPPRD